MTPSKPYLVRAVYEWIVDNELTPFMLVNAQVEGIQVPEEYIDHDGNIILNISPKACRGLHLGNSRVVFSARFSGVAMQLQVPVHAILAVYARENGRGMVFGLEDPADTEVIAGDGEDGGSVDTGQPDQPSSATASKPGKRPKLKVIK